MLVTASRPDLFLPVEAQGSLRLDAPNGRTLELIADGDTLELDVQRFRDIQSMVPRSARLRGQCTRALADTLSIYGLTLRVVSAGKSVFELGRKASPNWLARLLGLAPARVPLSAIALLFRR